MSRWIAAIGIVLFAASGRVAGGPLTELVNRGDELHFDIIVRHGEIEAVVYHPVSVPTEWSGYVGITEWDYFAPGHLHDKLTIEGKIRHVSPPLDPPHGEGPSRIRWRYCLEIDAGDSPPLGLVTKRALGKHGSHTDLFNAMLIATVEGLVFGEITGYIHTVRGVHIPIDYDSLRDRVHQQSAAVGHAVLTGDQAMSPTDTGAIGGMYAVADGVAGTLDMSVFAYDIDPGQITFACIHRGGPGEEGPVLYDLDAASFRELEGGGIERRIEGASLPPELLEVMLYGDAYVDIHTDAFPDGELRGQLVYDVEFIPEPSTLALLTIAALVLLAYAWRRRRWR